MLNYSYIIWYTQYTPKCKMRQSAYRLFNKIDIIQETGMSFSTSVHLLSMDFPM